MVVARYAAAATNTARCEPSSTPSLMPWRTNNGPRSMRRASNATSPKPIEQGSPVRSEEVAQPERLALGRLGGRRPPRGSSSAGGSAAIAASSSGVTVSAPGPPMPAAAARHPRRPCRGTAARAHARTGHAPARTADRHEGPDGAAGDGVVADPQVGRDPVRADADAPWPEPVPTPVSSSAPSPSASSPGPARSVRNRTDVAISSSSVPSSTARPSSITTIRSARSSVERRWAITMVVRSLGDLAQRGVDLLLGARVDRRRGVVEHEDARVGEHRASDGDALPLTPRQREPALADGGVVPVGEGTRRTRAHRRPPPRGPRRRRSRRVARRQCCCARSRRTGTRPRTRRRPRAAVSRASRHARRCRRCGSIPAARRRTVGAAC